MEDKRKICDLLPALQATHNLRDLDDLEYDPDKDMVLATFANGSVKKVNVALDSGASMIQDIAAKII